MTDTPQNSSNIQSQLPPQNLVASVWKGLIRATNDRHHHWRTPALASIGIDGHPQVRTIVLRHAHPLLWTLQAFPDARSFKCQELTKYNHAQLVFWSPRLRWQLRVSVTASIHTDGDVVATAWSRMRQSKSAKDYLSSQAPGSAFFSNDLNEIPSQNLSNQHYLAVINFQVVSIDWLELGKDIHRRARIDSSGHITPLKP